MCVCVFVTVIVHPGHDGVRVCTRVCLCACAFHCGAERETSAVISCSVAFRCVTYRVSHRIWSPPDEASKPQQSLCLCNLSSLPIATPALESQMGAQLHLPFSFVI